MSEQIFSYRTLFFSIVTTINYLLLPVMNKSLSAWCNCKILCGCLKLPPLGHRAIGYILLTAIIQQILCPSSSPAFKSTALQYREITNWCWSLSKACISPDKLYLLPFLSSARNISCKKKKSLNANLLYAFKLKKKYKNNLEFKKKVW